MEILSRMSTTVQGDYETLTIQLMRRNYKDSLSTETIGYLRFLRNTTSDGNEYFGLSYNLDTHNPKSIVMFGKIATTIQATCSYKAQPSEILQVLGAKEVYNFKSEFLLVTDKGSRLWEVMQGSQVYQHIVAPNEVLATKKLAKLTVMDGTLGQSYLIQ